MRAKLRWLLFPFPYIPFFLPFKQDYCVQYSARDAADLGYKTFVVEDASRGIAQDTIDEAKTLMEKAGVKLIKSTDIQ